MNFSLLVNQPTVKDWCGAGRDESLRKRSRSRRICPNWTKPHAGEPSPALPGTDR